MSPIKTPPEPGMGRRISNGRPSWRRCRSSVRFRGGEGAGVELAGFEFAYFAGGIGDGNDLCNVVEGGGGRGGSYGEPIGVSKFGFEIL